MSISLTESINQVGPSAFDITGESGGFRFTLVPNDIGVQDMTGATIVQTEDGIRLRQRGDSVEMVRVRRD